MVGIVIVSTSSGAANTTTPPESLDKAQATGPEVLVEVRGVEPRSAEFFVSNSPSAAAGWLSAGEITAAVSRRPFRDWLGPAVPESRRGHPALATPLSGGAGTRRRGRATYLSGSQRHLWFGTCFVYPVVLRGTGNLGSLPTRRLLNVESKSPPCFLGTANYTNPLVTYALGFCAPSQARSPPDDGRPDGDPSPSPGVARVRG